MKHKHSVYDTDAHFSINPFTRAIKNESTAKVAVIQHDHNSERFTFEIPRLAAFRIITSKASTVDELAEYLSNNTSTILYALKTPAETALSDAEITAFKALHSNKPVTTILNDAGAFMAVEYVADTKTYIDKKIKELMEGSE